MLREHGQARSSTPIMSLQPPASITTLLVCLVQLPTTTSPSKPISRLLLRFSGRLNLVYCTSYKLLHDSLCLARPQKGPLRSPTPTQSAARQFHGVQTTRTLAHQ